VSPRCAISLSLPAPHHPPAPHECSHCEAERASRDGEQNGGGSQEGAGGPCGIAGPDPLAEKTAVRVAKAAGKAEAKAEGVTFRIFANSYVKDA
jgi:hypothetical protein